VLPSHELPDPTPTTSMGLHVNPRRTFRSERLMPMVERIAVPCAELALGLCVSKQVTVTHRREKTHRNCTGAACSGWGIIASDAGSRCGDRKKREDEECSTREHVV
jgi:hypothetical protein